jgi:hypothetical protein
MTMLNAHTPLGVHYTCLEIFLAKFAQALSLSPSLLRCPAFAKRAFGPLAEVSASTCRPSAPCSGP